MKRICLITVFLILAAVSFFADTDFYWYRPSDSGNQVSVFKLPEEKGVILVAAGESGIFTSMDGITWTKREYEGYVAWHHRAVSGNGNSFVVGGDYGAAGLVTSDDGIKWTAQSLTGSGIHDIVWSNSRNLYVAVGEWGQTAIRWSSDGKSWSNAEIHSGQTLNAVAWGNGKFVAVGEWGDGGIYSSSDGINWVKGNNRTGSDFYGIAYGNGKFVAVGDGVIAYLSDSSSEWIETTSGFSTYHKLNDIIWDGSLFVAVGDAKYVGGKTQAIIYTSTNGINWTRVDTPVNKNLKSITYSTELSAFFAVGPDVVVKSSNGLSWETVNTKDPKGDSLSIKLDSIFAAPVSADKTEWAVFAINGRIKLTGSSSIEPFDYNNISGSVGINANSKINGEYPVSLGQGPQSVISPCYNFYFGPDSDPTTLVGDINQGDEAKNRVNCLRNDSKILDKIQEFYIPSWLAFEETGISGLPDKGSYQAGWNGGPFVIGYGDSGYYDTFEVLSELTIKVYDEDIIIHANTFKVSGSGGQEDIRVERRGKGRVFILVNESFGLTSNARIYSYDGLGNKIEYDDNLFIFYNGTAPMSGWPQFHFSGLLYVKRAPMKIGGSTSVSGLVSLHDEVTVSGAGISSHYVYAPYADITIDNSGEVQGSVIGKSIDILNNGKIKYKLTEVPVPEIPSQVSIFDWVVLTKEGYDLQDNGIDIRGDVAIWQTKQVDKKTNGNPKKIAGDIIVNEFVNGKSASSFNGHNTGTVYQKSFDLPQCFGEYDANEDYTSQLQPKNNKPDELNLGAGNVVIEGNVFVMSSGEISVKGNFTLKGGFFAPNASRVEFQNGSIVIEGGVCTPNAILDIKGNIKIYNKVYVRFLDINGSAEISRW